MDIVFSCSSTPGRGNPLLFATLFIFFVIFYAPIQAKFIYTPLDGEEFRCCTIPEPPIVRRDNTAVEGFSGLAIEYLRLLQLKVGFRCKSLALYKDVRGGNTTFDELVGNLANCSTGDGGVRQNDSTCPCDIGVGGWSINNQRVGQVDFVEPFMYDYYRVITHANNTMNPMGDVFFFTAFTTNVWICVFVLIAIFSVLKIIDDRFAPLSPHRSEAPIPPEEMSLWGKLRHRIVNTGQVVRLNQGFQSVVTHMMGHSAAEEIKGDTRTMRQWVLNLLIFISGLFLVLTYEASMTNALVNETWKSQFNGLEDFKKCLIPADQVCIVRGSGVHSFWIRAVETQPCHQLSNAPKVYTRETLEQTFRDFLNYKCKYMVGVGTLLQQYRRGPHCRNLRITGEPFRDTALSFILPQWSNITYKMSNATMSLRYADLIPTPRQFLASGGECNEDEFFSISFVKLFWFFVLVFMWCGIIFLLMLSAQYKMRGTSTQDSTNVAEENPRTDEA